MQLYHYRSLAHNWLAIMVPRNLLKRRKGGRGGGGKGYLAEGAKLRVVKLKVLL